MEEKKEDGDSEIQEHGPEHWFSKWERQCLAEAEQREPSEEEADNDQDKLWHLFQNSATAVAQLYKGPKLSFLSLFFFLLVRLTITLLTSPVTLCLLLAG